MSGCNGSLCTMSDRMKHSIISCLACNLAMPRMDCLKASSSSSCVSLRVFMGRPFPGCGWSGFHCTGLGRPARFPLALVACVLHAASVFFLPETGTPNHP